MSLIDKTNFDDILLQVGSLKKHVVMTALFRQMCAEFEIEHLHFSTTPRGESHDFYVVTTYPDAWIDFYYLNQLLEADPVRLRVWEEKSPIRWPNVMTNDERETSIMNARFAMIGPKGITMPFYSSNGHRSLLSVVGRPCDLEWSKRFNRLFPQLKQFGMAMHAAVLKLWGEEPPQVQLSARHVDCLKMLASGLNEKQISCFLQIREKSVKTYIEEAKIRLQAKTKVQVVANAIALGVISLS